MFKMHWLLGKLIILISFRFVLSPEDAEQDLISFLNKKYFFPLSFLSPSRFYEKKAIYFNIKHKKQLHLIKTMVKHLLRVNKQKKF